MRESQSQTSQRFYPASELEEGGHYVFTVWAETSAGRGTETTANITIGSNPEPGATSRPIVVPGQSSVSLSWKDPEYPDIIGHLIQAKRVSNDSIFEVCFYFEIGLKVGFPETDLEQKIDQKLRL